MTEWLCSQGTVCRHAFWGWEISNLCQTQKQVGHTVADCCGRQQLLTGQKLDSLAVRRTAIKATLAGAKRFRGTKEQVCAVSAGELMHICVSPCEEYEQKNEKIVESALAGSNAWHGLLKRSYPASLAMILLSATHRSKVASNKDSHRKQAFATCIVET